MATRPRPQRRLTPQFILRGPLPHPNPIPEHSGHLRATETPKNGLNRLRSALTGIGLERVTRF